MVAFPYKLAIPQRPQHLVTRPRLLALLQGVVERRLLTLTAPAGYGKTSALIDFATSAPPLPICWYTLDRFDCDPWTFLSYVAESIRQPFPEYLPQTSAVIAQGTPTSFAALSTLLLQEINAIAHDFVLVIDDWHLVDDVVDINELVAQILMRCPRCHLILASRLYPGLPDLMLLAARRQMSGLDEERLRFTPLEVAAVISSEYAVEVSSAHATLLTERANGWITGILLALQATSAQLPALVEGQIGGEYQIYRFLGEQVFDRQPTAAQQFLLESSLLDEMTVVRCEQITGVGDGRRMLEQLTRQHVFITEPKPGVWRYHPLFREFLQNHFRTADPQRYKALALRVADDYAARSEWTQAFDSCVAVDDFGAAHAVALAGGEQLYTAGRLETLERWFAALPLDLLSATLLCLKARVLIDRGQIYEAGLMVDLAARRMLLQEQHLVRLQEAMIARYMGRYEEAIALCQQVLAATEDDEQRAAALRTTAICYLQLAQPTLAIEHLLPALEIERARGNRYLMAIVQIDLGRAYESLGRLGLAEQFYSQADDYWTVVNNQGERALTLNNKGVVQHLAGRYREGYASFTLAASYAQQAGMLNYQALALASLGDLYSDLRCWEQSTKAYEQARSLTQDAFLTAYLTLMQIRLLVRQRRFAAADQALRRCPESALSELPVAGLLLKGQVAHGLGRNETAQTLAKEARRLLEQAPVAIDQARLLLLEAQIAAAGTSKDNPTLALLDQALALAEQVGHDAFLVAETLHLPDLMRRAETLGWEAATGWVERQQELRQIGRTLDRSDERPILRVRTLGGDQIVLDDQVVEIGWLKAREVFFYLLAHPAGASPEQLCDQIWPELTPEKARETLRSAIYKLRSQLPRELILLQGKQRYLINQSLVQIDYDVEQLLELLHAGDAEDIFAACDLYSGEYLAWSEGEWSTTLRSRLEEQYLEGLRDAAVQCVQAQAFSDGLFLFRRILAIDELDEAAHAGVMRCQIGLGNRAAAIEQYHQMRTILALELGLDPGPLSEAERLYHDILATS